MQAIHYSWIRFLYSITIQMERQMLLSPDIVQPEICFGLILLVAKMKTRLYQPVWIPGATYIWPADSTAIHCMLVSSISRLQEIMICSFLNMIPQVMPNG